MSLTYTAEAPSNIAFIKYWGKSSPSEQWPANDSFSMTLNQARTRTILRESEGDHLNFGGTEIPSEHPKAQRIWAHVNLLRQIHGTQKCGLEITTANTFPSDCGIASSASGFAALTLGVLGFLTGSRTTRELEERIAFDELAHLVRLGSGSACRSLRGGFVQWERSDSAKTQRVIQHFGEEHWALSDVIVLIDQGHKPLSSSEAHARVPTSLLFTPRLAGIGERTRSLLRAMELRDWERLGDILETEALEIHALIMTARNPGCYLTEKTCSLIAWVRKERALGNFPAYFTIDAGPNVHLICPREDEAQICERLREHFPHYSLLKDRIGAGPTLEVSASL